MINWIVGMLLTCPIIIMSIIITYWWHDRVWTEADPVFFSVSLVLSPPSLYPLALYAPCPPSPYAPVSLYVPGSCHHVSTCLETLTCCDVRIGLCCVTSDYCDVRLAPDDDTMAGVTVFYNGKGLIKSTLLMSNLTKNTPSIKIIRSSS